MYCERCSRIIEEERCPYCKSRRVREPEPKDPCFLTEQDYISSGILEDVLKQNDIPFLKKDVMGAGLAIKVLRAVRPAGRRCGRRGRTVSCFPGGRRK